jgi:hypothetical protein
MKKKPCLIKNNVVYDPNIDAPTVFDDVYDDVKALERRYNKGNQKPRRYKGI